VRARRSFPALAILSTAVLLLAGLPGAEEARAEDVWKGVERVVAVGDVHGDYDQFLTVLKAAGVVDEKDRWSGGRTHLVQVGDRLDRGPDSRKVMDLMMRLEKEAPKAGGYVHSLIGNHEAMNVLGDLRYVSEGEYAAFVGPDSAFLRMELWKRIVKLRRSKGEPPPGPDDQSTFDAEHPLGWVEHRRAFSPDGTYGKWIGRQNAVIQIDDSIFLHGGLSPKYADFSIRDLNDRIRKELQDADPTSALLASDGDGPLWFRGLARGDPALADHLQAVLQRLGARRMVVGHTPTPGLVLPLYEGRLVMIDVGLSKVYGGPPACLVLEEGRAYALHRGKRLLLPEGDRSVADYVREVMALEPDPSRLKALLEGLEAPAVRATPATAP
jgi:hypothetical protein